MWRVTLRNLAARKVRLAISTLAIVLGVAFVAGSFIFTDSLRGAFHGIVEGTTADVEVLREGAAEVDTVGTDVHTMPRYLADQLADLPEAAHVTATAQVVGVYVIGTDGKLVGGNGPPGLAFNYNETIAITGDRVVTLAEGRIPAGPREVALDVDTARKAGYSLGDVVTLATPGKPPIVRANLVGLISFGSEGGLIGATLTVFDTAGIQQLFFAGRDVYTNISLTAADGVSPVELRDAARAILPTGIEAQTGEDFAESTEAGIEKYLGFINTFLLVFAAVSLVVGTFLIVNTFSILVAQRSRELALLRAMGASRRQVDASVMFEALVVGAIGSAIGVVLGYALALALKALFGVVGLDLGSATMPLRLRTVVVSFAVGVLVTLFAAYVPARRAGHVAPVAVMQEQGGSAESARGGRLAIGLVVAVAGGGVMALGLLGSGSFGLALIGLGMLIILVGVSICAATLGRPLVAAIGVVFRRLDGEVGTLATANALRNPRRTGATASAVMVGLTLVALMSVLGQSAKVSTDRAIEQSLRADLVVSNATGQFFSPAYADEIRELPGVASVTQLRMATAKVNGSLVFVQAIDPSSAKAAVRLMMVSGSAVHVDDHTILVSDTTLSKFDLTPGDTITLTFFGGDRTFEIGGVYPSSGGVINEDFLVTLGGLERAGIKPQDSLLYITKSPGAPESEVRAAIDQVLADNPTVTLKNQKEYADEQKGLISTFLYLIYALLGLAVVIAVLGITNTLALSVIERTREVGLLRAVGLERRQLRSMITLESIAIATLGAVLGIVMGVGFGVVLQRSIADQGIDVLAIPWIRLGAFVVVTGAVGVIAALLPARRAARLDVLRAISSH